MLLICNGMNRSGSTLQYNIVRGLVKKTATGESKGYFDSDAFGNKKELLRTWAKGERYFLIKAHFLPPNAEEMIKRGEMRVLYTYRDIRDVAVSQRRQFGMGGDDLLDILDTNIAHYYKVTSMPHVLIQRYEELVEDIPSAVETIAANLGLSSTRALIDSVARGCSIESVRMTIDRFVLRNHRCRKLHSLLQRCHLLGIVEPLIQRIDPKFNWQGSEWDQESLLHVGHVSANSGASGIWRNNLSAADADVVTTRYRDWLEETHYL